MFKNPLKRKKKGQSTLEYILLVTAVVVLMITFLLGPNSLFKTKLNTTLDTVTTKMTNMAGRL